MLIVTDSESNSSTAEVAGQVESYCSIYILRYGLRALRMDSFFILSEMTDKTRRVAPAQYEPQTEQSPTFAAEKKKVPGLLFMSGTHIDLLLNLGKLSW